MKDKTADEILHLTVCEPAMGSAAFLNEAINQLAEAYLTKKQEELGDTISYDKRFEELQKVKMFIADRNVYGCDLNPVAVELAEVSLWLNTIYKGAYVPWFGTQLVNGNSLIGARRQVYSQSALETGKWYDKAPRRIMPGEERTKKRQHEHTKEIYHFLLGDPGMANYSDKVIKSLEPENIKKLKSWNKDFTSKFDDDELKTVLRLSESIDKLWKLTADERKKIRALAGDEHRNDIFIVGDSHQRIYKNKAVLSKCGINVRGRSSYLRINYRTTEEIRKFAFGLLNGVSFDDLDEDYDNGKGCQSLTHGDKPEIKKFATPEEELNYLVSRIHKLEKAGVEQKNICIVARTHKLLDSYIAGLQRVGIKSFEIKANKTDDRSFEGVRIATMHRVKGLEFDHVFAVAVNKKVLPFGTKADFEDDISLEEFRTGEKCLLYVALTRARKSACVTCYGGLSELIV